MSSPKFAPTIWNGREWIMNPDRDNPPSDEQIQNVRKALDEPLATGMKSLSQRRAEIANKPVGDDFIADLLPTSPTLMLIAGRPAIGKTFILLDLLCCLASGKPYLSHKCKWVNVGFLSLEGDEGKLLRRIDRLVTESYPGCEKHFGWTHSLPVKLNTAKGKEWLRQLLTGKQVVGIDTLTKLCGGDINSPRDVAAFLDILRVVMSETQCSVIGTLHLRKPDKRYRVQPSDLIFEIRGAVDFVAEAQSVLLLEKARQERGEFGKFAPTNLDGRCLYVVKAKDSPVENAPVDLHFDEAKLRFLPSTSAREEDILSLQV